MNRPSLSEYSAVGRAAARFAVQSADSRLTLKNRLIGDVGFLLCRRERENALNELDRCADMAAYLAFARRHFWDGHDQPGPTQLDSEIIRFLMHVDAAGLRNAVEIGTQSSGTTFLLANAIPTIRKVVAVDLLVGNRSRLRRLKRSTGAIRVIDGNSSAKATFDRVRDALDGEPIDLLFIDGDHSFAGAASDFLRYRRLVRDHGIVAFHDIVPDDRFAVHTHTVAYAGEVPLLWDLLRRQYQCVEFVESWTQRGLGIGALEYDSRVEPRLDPIRAELTAAGR